jgi:formylglycine-generating enzyme required for sulfatase activity
MGQDGGTEGSGPSVHINVDYSYWISKYKITNNQFCEFLNLAKAADLISSDTKLSNHGFWTSDKRSTPLVNYDEYNVFNLVSLGDNALIRWNVNQFEVNKNGNHAAQVSMHGAAAFASWHGFFLPNELQWEKAARGEFDDAGEHRKFAWGNDKSDFSATDKPVGWFNGINTSKKVENYFGIYDLTANREWVFSRNKKIYSDYSNVDHIRRYYNIDSETGKVEYDEEGNIRYSSRFLWYTAYKTVGHNMIYQRSGTHPTEMATFRVLRIQTP